MKTAVASETETPRKITQGSKTNKTRYLMWWETRGKWRHCLAKDLVSTAYATISEGSSYSKGKDYHTSGQFSTLFRSSKFTLQRALKF